MTLMARCTVPQRRHPLIKRITLRDQVRKMVRVCVAVPRLLGVRVRIRCAGALVRLSVVSESLIGPAQGILAPRIPCRVGIQGITLNSKLFFTSMHCRTHHLAAMGCRGNNPFKPSPRLPEADTTLTCRSRPQSDSSISLRSHTRRHNSPRCSNNSSGVIRLVHRSLRGHPHLFSHSIPSRHDLRYKGCIVTHSNKCHMLQGIKLCLPASNVRQLCSICRAGSLVSQIHHSYYLADLHWPNPRSSLPFLGSMFSILGFCSYCLLSCLLSVCMYVNSFLLLAYPPIHLSGSGETDYLFLRIISPLAWMRMPFQSSFCPSCISLPTQSIVPALQFLPT